jgi:hypothetical protein
MQHRAAKPMPSGLLEHLKKDTSQETDGIGRMIKEESLLTNRSTYMEEVNKLSTNPKNRIQRENDSFSSKKDFYFTGFQPATPNPQHIGVHQLLQYDRTDEHYAENPLGWSDDAEAVPPNPQDFPYSGSEEPDDELNDYYNNRIELEELVVNEVAFERKCGDSDLKITAITSLDTGVVLLATDRLEIYTYDIKLGVKQLRHSFDPSIFSSYTEGIRARMREKPCIDNLLYYNTQTYILMVGGSLLKFDPNSESLEPVIPAKQAREQSVLQGIDDLCS